MGPLPHRRAIVKTVALALLIVGPSLPAPVEAASWCRSGDPMANVRDPGRLRVQDRCQSASGIVRGTVRRHDGDIDVYLRPEGNAARLTNGRNRSEMQGDLLGEIVPADQPGCRKGESVRFGRCTGAAVRTPKAGSKVTLIGPHVLDRDHGWMEIHPVWHIVVR